MDFQPKLSEFWEASKLTDAEAVLWECQLLRVNDGITALVREKVLDRTGEKELARVAPFVVLKILANVIAQQQSEAPPPALAVEIAEGLKLRIDRLTEICFAAYQTGTTAFRLEKDTEP